MCTVDIKVLWGPTRTHARTIQTTLFHGGGCGGYTGNVCPNARLNIPQIKVLHVTRVLHPLQYISPSNASVVVVQYVVVTASTFGFLRVNSRILLRVSMHTMHSSNSILSVRWCTSNLHYG